MTALGPYQLAGVLGEGSMGVVYRAVDVRTGTDVAVKVLRAELVEDETFVRRFTREGDVAAALDHPHVVPVLDRGALAGRHYLVTAYVNGTSLADQLTTEGPLPLPHLVRVVAHIGGALDALHRTSLVHRDVKPGNVLLAEDGRALLTDFGLARAEAHATLTRAGRTVGTADYLAPEVIRGARAGPEADIYALGCMTYECATGAPPFADKPTLGLVCAAHLQEEPPDPRGRRDLPEELVRPLLSALAKDPARRPATGTAYARLLHAAVKGA